MSMMLSTRMGEGDVPSWSSTGCDDDDDDVNVICCFRLVYEGGFGILGSLEGILAEAEDEEEEEGASASKGKSANPEGSSSSAEKTMRVAVEEGWCGADDAIDTAADVRGSRGVMRELEATVDGGGGSVAEADSVRGRVVMAGVMVSLTGGELCVWILDDGLCVGLCSVLPLVAYVCVCLGCFA